MEFKISKGKHSVQTEKEICKLRLENAHLKKALDELSPQTYRQFDSESNSVLLQRILALETLKEENSQLILARDQEIASHKQQIQSDSTDIVTSLQAQLEQQREDAETKERLFQSLKQETETVKNKLVDVSTKCQNLQIREDRVKSVKIDDYVNSKNTASIQDQLKDALEKNQQWFIYDQQREAYVKTVLAKLHQMDRQLNQAKEALKQRDKRTHSEGQQAAETWQQHRKELDDEELRSAELQQQIQASAKELKEAQHDNQHLQRQLKKLLCELRKANSKVARLESEVRDRLAQCTHCMESAVIQSSNPIHCGPQRAEKEPSPKLTAGRKEERTSREQPQSFLSPTRACGLLDKSFLECPHCKAQYSTSRHRELLIHIDECLD